MGNQIQTCQNFLSQLSEPITVFDRRSQQPQQIYRNRQLTTQFFIKISRSFTFSPDHNEYLHYLERLKQSNHDNIVRLYFYQLSEEQQVCNRQLKLDCFYAFYNFRLSDITDRKYVSKEQPIFKQSELLYICHSILSVIKQLQKEDMPLGGFSTKDLFLTTEGQLKYYPDQLRKDYSHIAFLKVLKDINCLPDYYLSPEQLEAVRHVDYNSQEDYKVQTAGDIFSLGMVMLECLTLESSSKYYSVKGLELKSQKLLSRLGKLQHDSAIVTIIQKCLEWDPKNRIKLHEALEFVSRWKFDNNIDFFSDREKSSRVSNQSTTTDTSKSVLRLRIR